MADVFISYAKEDRECAALLAAHLAERGFSVWWDRDLLPGEKFRECITAELQGARCVVVLWSTHSVSSDWVQDEAGVAAKRGVLVPACLDGHGIPLGFQQTQTATLSFDGGFDDEELARLVYAIAKKTTSVPAPPMRGGSRSPNPSYRTWQVVGGIAIIAVAALIVFSFANRDSRLLRVYVPEKAVGKNYKMTRAGGGGSLLSVKIAPTTDAASTTPNPLQSADGHFPRLEIDLTNSSGRELSLNSLKLDLVEVDEIERDPVLVIEFAEGVDEAEKLRIARIHDLRLLAIDSRFYLYHRKGGELDKLADELVQSESHYVIGAFVNAAGFPHADWKTVEPVDFLLTKSQRSYETPIREQLKAGSSLTIPIVMGAHREIIGRGALTLVLGGEYTEKVLDLELHIFVPFTLTPQLRKKQR